MRWLIRQIGMAVLAGFLLTWSSLGSAAGASPWTQARVYSDIRYIAQEGETVGREVALLPHTDGMQVLWRDAGPRVYKASLMDAEPEMEPPYRRWVIELPKDVAGGGKWVLEEKGLYLIGIGPEGRAFRLKRVRG
jgi:hypothetical protein